MSIFDIFKKKNKASAQQIEPKKQTAQSVSTPLFTVTTEIIHSPDPEILPADERLKTAITSAHGLYPHEVLVLDYAQTYYTDGNTFQGFWWYQYGVRNVDAILCDLLDRGFLKIGDLQSAIEKETATTIKKILKNHSLKLSGKKSDLVRRLLDEVSAEELKFYFTRRTYQLTLLGKQALEQEAYIPYIHRHMYEDLDIWSLNKIINTPPRMSYRDKLWGYFNQRSMEHIAAHNYGLYRNCRYSMYLFLSEEKRYKDALGMLAEVVFYDLSGVGNGYDPQFLYIYAESFFPYKASTATMAPSITSAIMHCQKELGMTDEELTTLMLERMDKLGVLLQLFTSDECVDIVFMESLGETENLTKIYAKARRKFKQNYPNIKV